MPVVAIWSQRLTSVFQRWLKSRCRYEFGKSSGAPGVLTGVALLPMQSVDFTKSPIVQVCWSDDGAQLFASSNRDLRSWRVTDGGGGATVFYSYNSPDVITAIESMQGGIVYGTDRFTLETLTDGYHHANIALPVTINYWNNPKHAAVSRDGSIVQFGYETDPSSLALFSIIDGCLH
jgi:hypothetical protein